MNVCMSQKIYQRRLKLKWGITSKGRARVSMHELPGSSTDPPRLLLSFYVKNVCFCQNVYQSKLELTRGIRSNGGARA